MDNDPVSGHCSVPKELHSTADRLANAQANDRRRFMKVSCLMHFVVILNGVAK